MCLIHGATEFKYAIIQAPSESGLLVFCCYGLCYPLGEAVNGVAKFYLGQSCGAVLRTGSIVRPNEPFGQTVAAGWHLISAQCDELRNIFTVKA